MSEEPQPAAEKPEVVEELEPAPEDEDSKERRRHSRRAMVLREAEIIAQNLKESGTRR